jgi:hypothetical protein
MDFECAPQGVELKLWNAHDLAKLRFLHQFHFISRESSSDCHSFHNIVFSPGTEVTRCTCFR